MQLSRARNGLDLDILVTSGNILQTVHDAVLAIYLEDPSR